MQISFKDALKIYKNQKSGKKSLGKHLEKFPIISSESLAGIIGDIFGDGHLQGEPKWRVDYTSKSIKELKRFENEINLIFGVKGKIRECKTNMYGKTFNYGVNNKAIAKILFLFGAPKGNKVLQPLKIPKWILEDKKYFKRFLQRLFDCEASVDFDRAISIEMWKSLEFIEGEIEFLGQIKSALKKYFDIDTTNPFTAKRVNFRKDGNKTQAVRLKIRRKDSIQKFFKHINFENNEKKLRLLLLVQRLGKSSHGVSRK